MSLFDLAEHTPPNGFEKFASDFQTPMFAGRYMASLIPAGAYQILEPTPGEGQLVKAIQEVKGFTNCMIYTPQDFFLLKRKMLLDCIVMNPPFSSKYANMANAPAGADKHGMRFGYYILQQCMEMADSVIALMPWFTLVDSDVRMRKLKKWGLRSITAMPRKTFDYSRIQTVVLELEKGYAGETVFKVYDLLKEKP